MIQKTFDSEYTRIKSIPNLLSYNMDQNNQWHFVYKLSKSLVLYPISKKTLVSRTTLSFHRYCAVQHPKPPNKITVTVLEVHFISYIFFQDLASSFKIWGQHKHSSPHAKQSSGRTGNLEDLAERTLNVVHFLDIQKRSNIEPTVQFALISSWKLPIFFDISGYLAPGCRYILQIYQAVLIFCNDTNLEKSHWLDPVELDAFLSEQPSILLEHGEKKQPDRAHPCTKIIQQTFNDLHKELPIETMFFFSNWVLLDILMNFLWNHMGLDQVMGEICRICFVNRFSLDRNNPNVDKSRRKNTVKLMMQL